MGTTLDEIFKRELDRLDELSKKGPLEFEDLRRLDILTRSLKNYERPEERDDPMEEVSSEDLIKLIKTINEEERPTPRRSKKNGSVRTASRKKAGSRNKL